MLKETGNRQIHKSGEQACHPGDQEDFAQEFTLPLKQKETYKVIVSFTCSH